MRALTVVICLTAWPAAAGEYSTRDLADQLLASRVCEHPLNQTFFTDAIMSIMARTGLPRETVTAQARHLADSIEEALDTVRGPTKAQFCADMGSGLRVY